MRDGWVLVLTDFVLRSGDGSDEGNGTGAGEYDWGDEGDGGGAGNGESYGGGWGAGNGARHGGGIGINSRSQFFPRGPR